MIKAAKAKTPKVYKQIVSKCYEKKQLEWSPGARPHISVFCPSSRVASPNGKHCPSHSNCFNKLAKGASAICPLDRVKSPTKLEKGYGTYFGREKEKGEIVFLFLHMDGTADRT